MKGDMRQLVFLEPEWLAPGSDFALARLGDAAVAVMICNECEFPSDLTSPKD